MNSANNKYLRAGLYDPAKAAQVMAAFILKNRKRAIGQFKMGKLLYLADCESLATSGFPILDEPRAALKNGPVNSITLGYMEETKFAPGTLRDKDFSKWIKKGKNGIELSSASLKSEDLRDISCADRECIDIVWRVWGGFSGTSMIPHMHRRKEWRRCFKAASSPISIEEILRAHASLSPEEIKDVALTYEDAIGL